MRRTIHFLTIVLAILSGCRASKGAQSLDNLRTIKVERHTMLMLGAKMPESSEFCYWSGATCTFKPGTFGGARAISLTKTESGFIFKFHFEYGTVSTDAVKAQIEDYTRALGKPAIDTTTKKGDDDLRELDWSDSTTSFHLFYKMGKTQVEASATLFDNALAAPVHRQ